MFLDEVFKLLLSKNPDPKTELNYTNNFTLLIAVVLSAQATDKSVNKATQNLFSKITTPNDLIKLGENFLLNELKTINYYKTKTKNIISLCEDVMNNFNSEVPSDFTSLTSLAGVGRKTANVVLAVAFNQPRLAVDTHVARLAKRLGLTKNTRPELIESDIMAKCKIKDINKLHHLFILHGRYICKSQKPNCTSCILNNICPKIF
jgi:endonuclease III